VQLCNIRHAVELFLSGSALCTKKQAKTVAKPSTIDSTTSTFETRSESFEEAFATKGKPGREAPLRALFVCTDMVSFSHELHAPVLLADSDNSNNSSSQRVSDDHVDSWFLLD
jgi:hypothetical protein